MGDPIVWASRLQPEIVLSTMEAEYVALSQLMRDVILIMGILFWKCNLNIYASNFLDGRIFDMVLNLKAHKEVLDKTVLFDL